MARKIANGSLVPDSTSMVAPTRGPQAQPAGMHQEEHRRGIGRGDDGADQQRLGPAEIEEIMRDRRGDGGGQQHAQGRECSGRRQHGAKGRKARAQTAVEQNERERDRADRVGQGHVIEADATGSGFAGQHADGKEDQQQRGTEPQRHKARQDAGQNQHRSEQNDDIDRFECRHSWCFSAPLVTAGRCGAIKICVCRARLSAQHHGRAPPGSRRLIGRHDAVRDRPVSRRRG